VEHKLYGKLVYYYVVKPPLKGELRVGSKEVDKCYLVYSS